MRNLSTPTSMIVFHGWNLGQLTTVADALAILHRPKEWHSVDFFILAQHVTSGSQPCKQMKYKTFFFKYKTCVELLVVQSLGKNIELQCDSTIMWFKSVVYQAGKTREKGGLREYKHVILARWLCCELPASITTALHQILVKADIVRVRNEIMILRVRTCY